MSANFANDPEFDDAIPKPNSRRGFRLVEVVVVLGIIAFLIALLIPANRSVGPASRRAQCVNNLKQIGLALHNYEQVHKALPPAYTVDANGRPLHSWRTLILPYLEQEALYQTIDLSKPWNDPANAKALETSVPVFPMPWGGRATEHDDLPGDRRSEWLLRFPSEPRRLAEITDAHESTLMVIEAGEENAVPWMAPVDADESLVMSLSPTSKLHHAGGTNACLVDCSVRFLKADTPAMVRRALISIAGNDNDVVKDW